MLVCLDIGNSTVAIGFRDAGSWVRFERISSNDGATAAGYRAQLTEILSRYAVDPAVVDAVSISSVVPPLDPVFDELSRELFACRPHWVRVRDTDDMRIAIDDPRELGSDLFANALAGRDRIDGSFVVVDFGTALTLTAVRAAGKRGEKAELMGVAIAPGLATAVRSLSDDTAQLPAIALEAPERAIGTNTVRALQSGIIFGYVGLVEGLVARFKDEIGDKASVIATGGMCRVLAPYTETFDIVDEYVTLDGIRLSHEHSRKGK